MKFTQKLKNIKETQIVASNLSLDELIDKNILNDLKKKFSKEGELFATSVRFHVVKTDKKRKNIVKFVESILLEHQSHPQTKNKIIVITSTNGNLLGKFLK